MSVSLSLRLFACAIAVATLVACGDDASGILADAGDASSADAGGTTDGGDADTERRLPLCESPTSCDSDDLSCRPLFGRPAANTGLGEGECGEACACDGVSWIVPTYDASFVEGLQGWTLVGSDFAMASDPYDASPRPTPDAASFCGYIVEDAAEQTYRLETFDSLEGLLAAGARVTHAGACGACSTLRDLAVYISIPDLTTPVRECGLLGLSQSQEAARLCLEALGFTAACADIWGYNAAHTAVVCLAECLALLDDPYHTPDGALNACIQCDEDQSGPVFKAVAGRTRRNSGLPTALCRPCETLARIEHVLP